MSEARQQQARLWKTLVATREQVAPYVFNLYPDDPQLRDQELRRRLEPLARSNKIATSFAPPLLEILQWPLDSDENVDAVQFLHRFGEKNYLQLLGFDHVADSAPRPYLKMEIATAAWQMRQTLQRLLGIYQKPSFYREALLSAEEILDTAEHALLPDALALDGGRDRAQARIEGYVESWADYDARFDIQSAFYLLRIPARDFASAKTAEGPSLFALPTASSAEFRSTNVPPVNFTLLPSESPKAPSPDEGVLENRSRLLEPPVNVVALWTLPSPRPEKWGLPELPRKSRRSEAWVYQNAQYRAAYLAFEILPELQRSESFRHFVNNWALFRQALVLRANAESLPTVTSLAHSLREQLPEATAIRTEAIRELYRDLFRTFACSPQGLCPMGLSPGGVLMLIRTALQRLRAEEPTIYAELLNHFLLEIRSAPTSGWTMELGTILQTQLTDWQLSHCGQNLDARSPLEPRSGSSLVSQP